MSEINLDEILSMVLIDKKRLMKVSAELKDKNGEKINLPEIGRLTGILSIEI